MDGLFTIYLIKLVFPKIILVYSFRYIDDIFMVTNLPLEYIKQELGRMENKDINIEIETIINVSINYLDVTITNENGQLKTSIYHKPTAEPYYLPNTSDHPHQYHRNIPYTAILRAARICSNVNDFNQERLRIEMTLLLSNYPPQIIFNQFLRFFRVNHAELLIKQLDEQVYQRLHRQLLYNSTQRKQQSNYSLQELVQHPKVLQQKPYDRTLMYVKYKFQTGSTTKLPHHFFEWWRKHYAYQGSPVNKVKVRILPKTNSTLEQLLIHKKPSSAMLTRMEPLHI